MALAGGKNWSKTSIKIVHFTIFQLYKLYLLLVIFTKSVLNTVPFSYSSIIPSCLNGHWLKTKLNYLFYNYIPFFNVFLKSQRKDF